MLTINYTINWFDTEVQEHSEAYTEVQPYSEAYTEVQAYSEAFTEVENVIIQAYTEMNS